MIKILVADDHAVVRAGLKQIIDATPDMVVADEASTGQEVLEKALRKDYDIVLLDITMPGRSGFDILKELRSQKPNLSILFLSVHPEEQYATRVLRMGASGYITKESVPEELITALLKVASGGKYISSSLAERLAGELEASSAKPPHQILSDREFQVLCMIALGKTVKDIAKELILSVKTISTYRSRILQKMNMRNNAEIIRYAIDNELI